jgi:hypothetical protein
MNSRILVKKLALIYFILLLFTSKGKSCGCDLTPYKRAVNQADEIFLGKVIELKEVAKIDPYTINGKTSYRRLVRATFEVEKKWKGNSNKIIEIYQETSSCMQSFDFMEKYIIYAKKHETSDTLSTWLCTRNADHMTFDWKYYNSYDTLYSKGWDDRPRLDEDFSSVKLIENENFKTGKGYTFKIIFGILCLLIGIFIGNKTKKKS